MLLFYREKSQDTCIQTHLQDSRFVLASSSLAFLFARSTIENYRIKLRRAALCSLDYYKFLILFIRPQVWLNVPTSVAEVVCSILLRHFLYQRLRSKVRLKDHLHVHKWVLVAISRSATCCNFSMTWVQFDCKITRICMTLYKMTVVSFIHFLWTNEAFISSYI